MQEAGFMVSTSPLCLSFKETLVTILATFLMNRSAFQRPFGVGETWFALDINYW